MLSGSRERIESTLGEDALVLDVGGWAKPFPRADWVLDLMPYETRGLYGELEPEAERFSADTWVELDMCERTPWPFADGQFHFAVCSQTLEDIRDPIWVCGELMRVARAGYIEVPSRLEEQSYGVHGPWVGWSHHRWLVDTGPGKITFVAKPHLLAGRQEFHFPEGFAAALTDEERVQMLFWEGSFEYGERIFLEAEELDAYLEDFVSRHLGAFRPDPPRPLARIAGFARRHLVAGRRRPS